MGPGVDLSGQLIAYLKEYDKVYGGGYFTFLSQNHLSAGKFSWSNFLWCHFRIISNENFSYFWDHPTSGDLRLCLRLLRSEDQYILASNQGEKELEKELKDPIFQEGKGGINVEKCRRACDYEQNNQHDDDNTCCKYLWFVFLN